MKHLCKATLVCCLFVIFAQTAVAQPGGQLCRNVTNSLWTETEGQSSIQININQTKTFRTRPVCNATSYTWTVGGGGSVTTSTNFVDFEGQDLVWLPPGGCDEFNENWTSYNPAFDKDDPESWPGTHPLGYYETTLSVHSNLTSSYTVPVRIDNVEFCYEPAWPIEE